MDRSELDRLSREELIELVLRLQRPDKTSRTSSKPPSSDPKERREQSRPGGAKPGHEGHSRALSEHPDATQDHAPSHCERCGLPFEADAEAEVVSEHDEIELPPVRPFVRRHRRLSLRCRCCNATTPAELPAAVLGTPFGPRIHALAVYLKGTQLFSYERLGAAFRDLFGLRLSEGALMNMFKRTGAAFHREREKALTDLRRAPFVACDETGVRIEGVGAYHWVFCSDQAVVHAAAPSRAAEVVRQIMGEHRPSVWTSDRYSAQQGHGLQHQTCLAHLRRDVRFAEENGEDDVPFRLRLWFERVFALAKGIETSAASTIRTKRRRLERDLDTILSTASTCALGRALIDKLARARHQLLTFCDFPGEVGPTNNVSERHLRPCVIQRKVTNGYRSTWAADYEADMRTTVDTARLAGADPYQTILKTICA